MDLPRLDSYGQRLLPGLRASLQGQRGALILCDQFTPQTEGEPPHGMLVAQVAAQHGFRGKVVAVPFEDVSDPRQQALNEATSRALQACGEASDADTLRENLYECLLSTRLTALDTATQRVLALQAAGAAHCALNLSIGSSAAMCVAGMLPLLSDPQAVQQLALAFGDKVAEGLVQTGAATSTDPRLSAAREQFTRVVAEFEAAGNSVVIGAGNDGNIASKLGVPVPAGFTRSDLITPDTTVVGALEGQQVASYTSDPGSVTIFAPGAAILPGVKEAVHGTSFAAPVVSSAMATFHGQHPELSSAEVERRLQGG